MKLFKCKDLSALVEPRGWSVEPVSSALLESGRVKNVHLVSIEPGTVRGNHVHDRQVESVMVFGGRCLVAAEDASGNREEMTVEPNQFILFGIPPGVAHAFKNIGKNVMYLLAFCDTPYREDEPDRRARRLLDRT